MGIQKDEDCLTLKKRHYCAVCNLLLVAKAGDVCYICNRKDKDKITSWDGKIDDTQPFPKDSGMKKNPWDEQEGGSHYKDMPIQPMQFSMENKMDALQHTIIKYVVRFRSKGGIEDLNKAKHCIDMLIQWESDHPVK